MDVHTEQAVHQPVRVGISSCLLGNAVRFDGGHKRDTFLTGTFGTLVEWVPVCPEVECGLGTPRESMRLVRVDDNVRVLTVRTAVDLTDRMEKFARRRVAQLACEGLSGYVLKKDSPSCGLERVKVYDAHGTAARSGRGLFASILVGRLPCLPVEEEGRLSDPRLRENFVERVFAYSRHWRGCWIGSATFQMMGNRSASVFVGQWAPTLLILGLYNKLVKQHGSDFTDTGAGA